MKKLPMNQMLQIMFTEDEWDAIYSAMADYQDHGEKETELAYSIQSKITALFESTEPVVGNVNTKDGITTPW